MLLQPGREVAQRGRGVVDAQGPVGEDAAPRLDHVAEPADEGAQALPHLPEIVRREGRQHLVESFAGKQRGDEQPGEVRIQVAAAYLQDGGHRQQATDQVEHRRVDLRRERSAVGRAPP